MMSFLCMMYFAFVGAGTYWYYLQYKATKNPNPDAVRWGMIVGALICSLTTIAFKVFA